VADWKVGDKVGPNHRGEEHRKALTDLAPPVGAGDHAEEAKLYYRPDPQLLEAINDAIAGCMPLLLEGEAGTGKTQVAYYIQAWFDIALYEFTVKSSSTAEELKWHMDHVGYLREANHRTDGDRKTREDFLTKGPVWRALEDPAPSVILIDEIDKAQREFPNDLLHELDQATLRHPFDNQVVIRRKCLRPPIFVITSNGERPLPEPFVRRCMRHKIELTPDMLTRAWSARSTDTARDLLAAAVDRFGEIRKRVIHKPPATGEFMSWMSYLRRRRVNAANLRSAALRELPGLRFLVKYEEDRLQL